MPLLKIDADKLPKVEKKVPPNFMPKVEEPKPKKASKKKSSSKEQGRPRTARDLITQAAKNAGIIDSIESLESGEASHALEELNLIIEGWNLDELVPFSNDQYEQSTFTTPGEIEIGPTGADIVATRPNRITAVAANVGGQYAPLTFIDQNSLWNSTILNNDNAGVPLYYTLLPGATNSTIKLYPTSTAYTITLSTQTVISSYTLNDEITLPAGYYPALQAEMSVYLAQFYSNLEVLPGLEKMAIKALARVKRLNLTPRLLKTSGAPGRGDRNFNIQSYTFYQGIECLKLWSLTGSPRLIKTEVLIHQANAW